MSHVPTVLKSDRSVFDKMLPVDDNGMVLSKLLSAVDVSDILRVKICVSVSMSDR